jgi:amino acid transporter
LTVYALLHRAPTAHAVPLRNLDLMGGILLGMWNYGGWDNASLVANSVDRPQRTYPRAMACSVALVALIYVLPVGAMSLTGLDPNRWSQGGWADVAAAVWTGSGGAAIALAITAAGLIATFGSQNALTLAYARLPAALADAGYLPQWIRQRTPSGTPWAAILLCAAIWIPCLTLSFSKLLVLDVMMGGFNLMLEFAALICLRLRQPKLPRPFRVPGGTPGTIVIGIPPLALMILAVIRSQVESIGPINAFELGLLLIAAGCGTYYLARRRATN